MNVCGGLVFESISYNAVYQVLPMKKVKYSSLFEYGIKQKAPTIVRLLMLINDVFLCLILEHQCCSSFECVRATAIAHR